MAAAVTTAATRKTPTMIRAASPAAHCSSASTTSPSRSGRSRSASGMYRRYASADAYTWSYRRSMVVEPYAVRIARPTAMPIMRATVTVDDAVP